MLKSQKCSVSSLSSNNEMFSAKSEKQQSNFFKPVFIISSNFQSKHIKKLTQMLESNKIPMQFQHETDTLGFQLNQHFFVVVDNKQGKTNLGAQFNSVLMTVIGYPKKGLNLKNKYCSDTNEILREYLQFVNKKKIKEQKPFVSIQNIPFKTSKSKGSFIKLKSISKYDKQQRQPQQKNNSFISTIKRKSYLQKQNRQISNDNLIFVQCLNNDQYNDVISRIYHGTKLRASRSQQIEYFRTQKQLIQRIAEIQVKKNAQFNQTDKKTFIVLNASNCLHIVKTIEKSFENARKYLKIIALSLEHHINTKENSQLIKLVRRTYKSNIFHSYVCTLQQCEKSLSQAGFTLKKQTGYFGSPKINQNTEKQSHINENQKQFEQTLQKRETAHLGKNQSKKSLKQTYDRISLVHSKTPIAIQNQTSEMPETNNKCYIPPISSLISEENKSTISLSKSKKKFIKVTRKDKSVISQNDNLSEINEVYKLKKNNGTTQLTSNNYRHLDNSRSFKALNSKQSIENVSLVQTPSYMRQLSESRLSKISQDKTRKKKQSRNNSDKNIAKASSLSQKSLSRRSKGSSSQIKNNTQYNTQYQNNLLFPTFDKQNQFSIAQKHPLNKHHQNNQTNKSLALSIENSKIDQLNKKSQEQILETLNKNQSSIAFSKQSEKQLRNQNRDKHCNLQQNLISPFFKSCDNCFDSSNNELFYQKTRQSAIDGLIYIEYNELIASIVDNFKLKCPKTMISEKSYKSFYLSRQYSRQLRKLWHKKAQRKIMPILTDIQGLNEIYKYYSNLFYEDDEYKISQFQQSCFKDKAHYSVHSDIQASTNKFHMLFFCVIPTQQQENKIFEKIEQLQSTLPKHEIIKCLVNTKDMLDNQMKDMSQQLYKSMFEYLKELSGEYEHRLVATE